MIAIQKQDHYIVRLMKASRMLRTGRYSDLAKELSRQLNSETESFGLCRDLQDNFDPPKAKINISVRHLKIDDIDSLLGHDPQDPIEARTISDQKSMLQAGIPGCYVAVTDEDKPCYMQWLISPVSNDMVAAHFKGIFPLLKPAEALLEGAYTPPAFRGMGIMPAAMAQIAEKAIGINASLVYTFVGIDNIASLKGCKRAGFEPYILRKDKWSLFSRSISFDSIPDQYLQSYQRNTAEKPRG